MSNILGFADQPIIFGTMQHGNYKLPFTVVLMKFTRALDCPFGSSRDFRYKPH